MQFIKNNLHDIIKLFVNQIGIAIFSMMLYTAVGVAENPDLSLLIKCLISVFASIFYLSLIYCAVWDLGARDKIRIDGNKMTPVKLKGMLLSLIANIPNFVLALVAIVTMLVHISTGNEGFYSAFAGINLFMRLLNSMFLGLIQFVFSSLENQTDVSFLCQSFGYLLAPVLTILVAHFGYEMGVREKRIFGKLFVKSTKR